VRWSPDGEWIAFSVFDYPRVRLFDDGEMWLIRPDGSDARPIGTMVTSRYFHASFHPLWDITGERLYFISPMLGDVSGVEGYANLDTRLMVYTPATGDVQPMDLSEGQTPLLLTLAPDGEEVSAVALDEARVEYDLVVVGRDGSVQRRSPDGEVARLVAEDRLPPLAVWLPRRDMKE
jgi:Tol biopolymer transport system component